MSKHRLPNEAFLDAMLTKFRMEVLERIDADPTCFLDASFTINVMGGKVTMSRPTYAQDGITITEKIQN